MPGPQNVTFTVPATGTYLPSIDTTLPPGLYKGRIVRDQAEHVFEVIIVLDRPTLDQMRLDKDGSTPLSVNITKDYQGGFIGEDWYL